MSSENPSCVDLIARLQESCQFDDDQISKFAMSLTHNDSEIKQRTHNALVESDVDLGKMHECREVCPIMREKILAARAIINSGLLVPDRDKEIKSNPFSQKESQKR